MALRVASFRIHAADATAITLEFRAIGMRKGKRAPTSVLTVVHSCGVMEAVDATSAATVIDVMIQRIVTAITACSA